MIAYAQAFKKILGEIHGVDDARIVTENENWIRIEDDSGVCMINKNSVGQITIFD